TSEPRPRPPTSARRSPRRCESPEIGSGPALAGGPLAVDVAAVVVDIAPQLPALLRSHARVAIGIAVRGVACRHLRGRRGASRRAATESAVALGVLRRRRKQPRTRS